MLVGIGFFRKFTASYPHFYQDFFWNPILFLLFWLSSFQIVDFTDQIAYWRAQIRFLRYPWSKIFHAYKTSYLGTVSPVSISPFRDFVRILTSGVSLWVSFQLFNGIYKDRVQNPPGIGALALATGKSNGEAAMLLLLEQNKVFTK